MTDTQTCLTPNNKTIAPNTEGLDELTPIADYMARQMTINAVGLEARRMRELNLFTARQCWENIAKEAWLVRLLGRDCLSEQITNRQAAMWIWVEKVAQDRVWDHKPFIRSCFRPRGSTTQEFHGYGERRYFYDIWSNIHYGYVGKASGFSDAMLLDGAGLEQIGSNLLKLKPPVRTGEITGRLRDWDGPNDRVSIQLGISLYQRYPGVITGKVLLQAILSSRIEFKLVGS